MYFISLILGKHYSNQELRPNKGIYSSKTTEFHVRLSSLHETGFQDLEYCISDGARSGLQPWVLIGSWADLFSTFLIVSILFLDEEMMSFVENENMEQMAERCSWIHVEVPGQGGGDTDLPSEWVQNKNARIVSLWIGNAMHWKTGIYVS